MLDIRKLLLAALVIGLLTITGIALAGTQIVEATLDGETTTLQFDTPSDFGFDPCPEAFPTSVINLQGDVPDGWQIFGAVTINAVNGGVITQIPITSLNQFPLTIDYGPVENYPVFQDPSSGIFLREVHVDISIGFVQNGIHAQFVILSDSDSNISNLPVPALGPENDWDVFCFDEPPGEEPPGDEGCTPGYWKNHTDSWLPTGFSTGQSVVSVFSAASAFPTLASNSLLTALDDGGGPGAIGGAQILLRAAVAALLNASHPDVAYTQDAASVISAVNAVLASGDRDTMIALAASLDSDNNLGCPLN